MADLGESQQNSGNDSGVEEPQLLPGGAAAEGEHTGAAAAAEATATGAPHLQQWDSAQRRVAQGTATQQAARRDGSSQSISHT